MITQKKMIIPIKNSIWRYIGYTPQEDNDEVDAYLTMIMQNCLRTGLVMV